MNHELEELAKNYKPVVFAYWVKGELKGFRADTFGTISNYPKIYGYSKEQVDIVLSSTKDMLTKSGTSFMKILVGKNIPVTNGSDVDLNGNDVVSHLSNTEDTVRSWGEFELAVHPFIGEFMSRPEQWRMDAEIASLRTPIEVHKFKVIKDEN